MCKKRYATTLFIILSTRIAPGSSFSLTSGQGAVKANLKQDQPAFKVPIFPHEESKSTIPSKVEGVDIPLPDFDELFRRICSVSPLARLALGNECGGFEVADEKCKCNRIV